MMILYPRLPRRGTLPDQCSAARDALMKHPLNSQHRWSLDTRVYTCAF